MKKIELWLNQEISLFSTALIHEHTSQYTKNLLKVPFSDLHPAEDISLFSVRPMQAKFYLHFLLHQALRSYNP